MNRFPTSSAGITEVGFHPDSDNDGTLELKFANGAVYDFFNVPVKTYDEFLHASSREEYYSAHIGTRFPCSRIG